MLGNNFPIEERCEYIREKVKPCCILSLFCDFIHEPKDKYLVLLHTNNPPLFFFINSKIHNFILSNPNKKICQVEIHNSDHSFLTKKTSYIDCSYVVDNFDMCDVINQLLADTGRIQGVASDSTTEQIIKKVTKAKTINKIRKSLIISGLNEKLSTNK